MGTLFVRFIPPYTNSRKRVEVSYKGEGYILRDWLRQQGCAADLILVTEDIDVLDDPLENAL